MEVRRSNHAWSVLFDALVRGPGYHCGLPEKHGGARVTKTTIKHIEGREHQDGIVALRNLSYPHILPEIRDTEFYYSVYEWFGRHPLAGEVRRWVAVTGDGQVVGHLAALPQYYRVRGERVVAHTPADLMVHPRHGLQTFALIRKFFKECENCVAPDMVPAVITIEERLGAEKFGKMKYAAKLLDVSRLPAPSASALPASALPASAPLKRVLRLRKDDTLVSHGHPDQPEAGRVDPAVGERSRPRTPVPAPLKKLANGGLRVADEALGVAFGGGLRVERMEVSDESFDKLFGAVAANVPCVPEKDAAFLRWRYGPGSPQHPVTMLGVRDGEALLGYAALWTPVTNDHDGYVFDLTTVPGRPDAARALLRDAVRFFRRRGAQIVHYRYLPSPATPRPQDLLRLGFFHREGRSHTLLARFADPAAQRLARNATNWAYSIGDGEATFWTQ